MDTVDRLDFVGLRRVTPRLYWLGVVGGGFDGLVTLGGLDRLDGLDTLDFVGGRRVTPRLY